MLQKRLLLHCFSRAMHETNELLSENAPEMAAPLIAVQCLPATNKLPSENAPEMAALIADLACDRMGKVTEGALNSASISRWTT